MSNSSWFMILCTTLALMTTSAQAFPHNATASNEPAPAGTAPAPTPAVLAATLNITKGTVIETMDGGGYTYLQIEKDGQKRWAAMPLAKVKVGQEVELASGTEMGEFTSKALNRTFKNIYFCGGLTTPDATTAPVEALPASNQPVIHPPPAAATMMPGGQGAMPPGHPGMPATAPNAEQAEAKTRAGSSQVAGKVVETMDGGGYTYAAIEKDGRRSWVAVPPTKLEVGQEVLFKPGFVMTNFNSKALNRSFETITFSIGLAEAQ